MMSWNKILFNNSLNIENNVLDLIYIYIGNLQEYDVIRYVIF